MNSQIQQPCAESQMSIGDGRGIKMEVVLSSLVMALVLGIVVMLIAFGRILFA